MRSVALLLAGALVGSVVLFRPLTVDPPADVALPPIPHIDSPVHLTFFGTSLTANYDWPEQTGDHLAACLGHRPQINRVAQPGAGSDWALTQITEVVASNPDVILIEFAINDADLRDGKSLAATRSSHRRIIAELRLGLPDTRIVLMTMSPAQGIRGTMRPWLSAHYAQYRDLAAELDLGLIDFYPRWLSLPRAMRGLEDDDLHPDPSVAAEIIVPILSKYLSALFGTTCIDQLNHSILKTGPIKELSHPPEALR